MVKFEFFMDKGFLYGKDYIESDAHTSSNIERASLYFEPIVNSIQNILKPTKILDIGCAKGFLVFLFHSINLEAYGVDLSSYAITHSSKEVKKNLFILDVEKENLPFPNSHFDLLTMIDVLEHLHFSSVDHLLNEIRRVLKPNGYLFITLPTKKEEKGDATHINLHPKAFWIDLFKKYNFLPAEKEKELLKKESQKYVWDNKSHFLYKYKKLLKNMLPATRLGKLLFKMGKIGVITRETLWLYNYFFRYIQNYFNQKTMLFKRL